MNKVKHTEGPWSICLKYGSVGAITHKDGVIAFPTAPRSVSDARHDGESWLDMRVRTQPERDAMKLEEEANAKLLAAAPAMLTALEWILDNSNDSLVVHHAKRAIDKATGAA